MPVNTEMVRYFVAVKDQHIMGFGGPVALDKAAALQILRQYGVKRADRIFVLEMVNAAYRAMLEAMTDEKKGGKTPDEIAEGMMDL